MQLAGAPCLGLLLLGQALWVPLVVLVTDVRFGALVVLASLACLAAGLPAIGRLCFARGAAVPRRLRVTADGVLLLDLAGGTTVAVHLLGRSVVAGPWLVLLLQGPREVHRVVIESFAVPAASRAALKRCLVRLAARPEAGQPALRSAVSTLWDPGRPAT